MELVELPADRGSLRLRSDDRGWCRVVVQLGGPIMLGADSYSVIKNRLLSTLRNAASSEPVGTLCGSPVVWVLGLSEPHSFIYAARSNDNLRLFFQDRDNRVVGTLDLTQADRQRWIEELTGVGDE